MCYRRGFAALCAILALTWAQWTEIFCLEIPHDASKTISHYIRNPFEPERHISVADAEAQGSSFQTQVKYPIGWFVLPGTFAALKDASQTNNARVERPKTNASVEVGGFGDVVYGLKMCRHILEKVILEREETIQPQVLKTELFLCHVSIQKFVEIEAELDGGSLSRKRQCLHPREQLQEELKMVCLNSGYSDLHACPSLRDSEDLHAVQRLEVHQQRIRRSDVSLNGPFDPRKEDIKASPDESIYHQQQACEDTVCPVLGLERICAPSNKHPNEETKAMCKMCYPKKDNALIRAHCVRRRRQEARVFYVLCALLVAAIATAVFLVLLRNIRKRARERHSIALDKQIKRTPVKRGSASGSSGLAGLNFEIVSLLRRLFSKSKRETADEAPHNVFDDTESSSPKIFTLQQRWNGLGLFTKGPRKRLQDVFDLESLKSTQGTLSDSVERVPVLPRARSNSVHHSLSEINTRPILREQYTDEIRLSNGPFATIHTTQTTQRVGIVPETSRSIQ